jgi:hypothetical protein
MLLLAACASGGARFEVRLPPELPDVSRWELSSGRAEMAAQRSVDYELYVSPERPSVYSVTRYRERQASEKLQWDRDGRDVRRYECVPNEAAAGAPCRWREFARGTSEYDGELRTLTAVYFLHAARLHGREAASPR